MLPPEVRLAEAAVRTIDVGDASLVERIAGPGHENLKSLAQLTGAVVGARGAMVNLSGDPERVELAAAVVQGLAKIVKRIGPVRPSDIAYATKILQKDPTADLKSIFLDVVVEGRGGRNVTPKGIGQKRYVDAIRKNDLTLGVGPAGTGKTYLAMALAVDALKKQQVARIILTRPAVEAGERLGFLPGDIEAKVNPYLRPLYDAMFDLLGVDEAQDLMGSRTIEVAPLAFMRGRTLNDSFVILDEAQNTTREQMKMFLTRFGFGSKVVVTGDVTQTDLPRGQRSGLTESLVVLGKIRGVAICTLTDEDVVRHPLVADVIRAYARFDEDRARARAEGDDDDGVR